MPADDFFSIRNYINILYKIKSLKIDNILYSHIKEKENYMKEATDLYFKNSSNEKYIQNLLNYIKVNNKELLNLHYEIIVDLYIKKLSDVKEFINTIGPESVNYKNFEKTYPSSIEARNIFKKSIEEKKMVVKKIYKPYKEEGNNFDKILDSKLENNKELQIFHIEINNPTILKNKYYYKYLKYKNKYINMKIKLNIS